MSDMKRYSPRQIRNAGMTTITAHSGCEGTAPNSREHIAAAIASGAEYIEIDVRSDNGELYLSHDLPDDPTKCVRFETLLQFLALHPAIYVNCDLKTDGLIEPVMAAAKRWGMAHRILFTGESTGHGEKVNAQGGTLWHGLWCSEDNEGAIRRAVEYCRETGCPVINLDKKMVNEANLSYVQASGLNYSVWTPDDEETLRFLLEKRVTNITTRQPRLALRLRDEIQGTPEENNLLPDGSIEKIIREAAKIMLSADADRLQVKQKDGSANFVTEYDVKVQHFLQNEFSALIPGCAFLAEEEGESENPLSDAYTFIIDPIDGTTNFMLGRRASCISVALLKDQKPVYGAVYDPYSDRYYSAMPGKGAFCNEQPIHVSNRPAFAGVALLGSAPYQKERTGRAVAEIAYELLMQFADLRRIGSAALEICSVACGEAESYCEPILSPWDFAACSLILTEAGGRVTDFNGNPIRYDHPTPVLAATSTVYDTILSIVKDKI